MELSLRLSTYIDKSGSINNETFVGTFQKYQKTNHLPKRCLKISVWMFVLLNQSTASSQNGVGNQL